MRGKGRRRSARFRVDGAGVCLQPRRGELVAVWGRWAGRDGGERTQQEAFADRTGASWRVSWVGWLMGQWRTGGVRLGVESLAAGPGRD